MIFKKVLFYDFDSLLLSKLESPTSFCRATLKVNNYETTAIEPGKNVKLARRYD